MGARGLHPGPGRRLAISRSAQRFLDAIQPFIWRRSLDFGVIEEVRQISARIRDHFAQGARIGPGYDLKRGRGGIREVEFFVQIQQMIHGGRDASVRAPATLEALDALVVAGSLDEGSARALADAYRLLRTIEHRVQMVEDAQTHLIPALPEALENVAQLHGLRTGPELIELLRPHVERAGEIFDSLSPDERRILSNDRDILRRELEQLGFADVEAAVRHVAHWRSGKARSLRTPAAQQAFEAMLPALLQAIAVGADPDRALNRLSDIVERLSSGVNLFRLLEARPPLAQLLAKVLAHAPVLADQLGRRPELFEGLFDASSFEMPPDAGTFAELLGMRCAASRTTWRSTACGGRSTNGGSRSESSSSTGAATRSRSPKAMRGLPKARWWRWARPPLTNSKRRMASFREAS